MLASRKAPEAPALIRAEYYPRFGFKPAAHFGLRCEFDAPAAAFMAIELERNYLAGVFGTVAYHAALQGV